MKPALLLLFSALPISAAVRYPAITPVFYDRLTAEYQTYGPNSIGGEGHALNLGEKLVIPLPSGAQLFSVSFASVDGSFYDAVLTDDSENAWRITEPTAQFTYEQFDPEGNPLPTGFVRGGFVMIDGLTVFLTCSHQIYDSDGNAVPDAAEAHWGTISSATSDGLDSDWAHLSGRQAGPLHIDPVSRKLWSDRVLQPGIGGPVYTPVKLWWSQSVGSWTQTTEFTSSATALPMLGKCEFGRVTYTLSGSMAVTHQNSLSGGAPIFYRITLP